MIAWPGELLHGLLYTVAYKSQKVSRWREKLPLSSFPAHSPVLGSQQGHNKYLLKKWMNGQVNKQWSGTGPREAKSLVQCHTINDRAGAKSQDLPPSSAQPSVPPLQKAQQEIARADYSWQLMPGTLRRQALRPFLALWKWVQCWLAMSVPCRECAPWDPCYDALTSRVPPLWLSIILSGAKREFCTVQR